MKWYVLLLNKDGWFSDGIDDKDSYNFNDTCKGCTNGVALKKGLNVKTKPKYDIDVTVLRDFVFSKSIFTEITNLGVSKNNFKNLFLSGDKIDYYVVAPISIAPKVSNRSKGIIQEEPCEICNNNGFYDDWKEEPEYYYSENDCFFENKILRTWELFGPSQRENQGNKVFKVARGRILVNDEVKLILEKYKSRNVIYKEVFISNFSST